MEIKQKFIFLIRRGKTLFINTTSLCILRRTMNANLGKRFLCLRIITFIKLVTQYVMYMYLYKNDRALSEIFHNLVPLLFDTAYFNRTIRKLHIRRYSTASFRLLNEDVRVMRICSEENFGRKGSRKCGNLRKL